MPPPKRGRGRPTKPDALSNAERQRRWRRRRAGERASNPPRLVNASLWWKLQRWDREKGEYVDTGVYSIGSLDYLVGEAFSRGIRGGVKDAVARERERLAREEPEKATAERNWRKAHPAGTKVVDENDLSANDAAKARAMLQSALRVPRIEYELTPDQMEKAKRIAATKGLPPPLFEGNKLVEREGGVLACLSCHVALEAWPRDLSIRCPRCDRIYARTEREPSGNVRLRAREIDRLRHLGIAPPARPRWPRRRRRSTWKGSDIEVTGPHRRRDYEGRASEE